MIRPGLEESMNIEETIKKYLPEEGGPAGVLAESMIYSLMLISPIFCTSIIPNYFTADHQIIGRLGRQTMLFLRDYCQPRTRCMMITHDFGESRGF